jgi:energy-coupling factor transporter transmembrane protein EcfT
MENNKALIPQKIPSHIHKGQNYLRILALIILIPIGILATISFKFYGLAFFPVLLGSLIGLFFIRFPKIYVHNDSFSVVKKGMLEKFNDYHTFKYSEIKKVEFSGGFTDWASINTTAIFGYISAGNNKADQLIIETLDGETIVYNRFGSKKEFVKTIDMIKRNVRPAANKV